MNSVPMEHVIHCYWKTTTSWKRHNQCFLKRWNNSCSRILLLPTTKSANPLPCEPGIWCRPTIILAEGRYYQTRVPRFAFGFAKFKHKIKEITCVPLPSKRTFECLPGWLAFRAVRAFQQDPTTNRAMPQRGFKRDSTLLSITT